MKENGTDIKEDGEIDCNVDNTNKMADEIDGTVNDV